MTRGRFRRLVAGLGVVVALAMVAAAVLGIRSATTGLRDDLTALGVDDASTEVLTWFWVYLVCAVLALGAGVLALTWLPSWPEMGARYDAPGGSRQRDQTDLDLWKALDEGRDPTLTDRLPGDP